MILMPIQTWSAFKTLVTAKGLRPQYSESSDRYDIYGEEHSFVWQICILKSGSDGSDFESNFKASWNKSLLPETDAFARTDEFKAACIGFAGTATKETTTNIDHTLADDRYIVGCGLILKDQVFGDKVKLQIVHPTYGVVNEFATDWNVSADAQDQGAFSFPLRGKLSAGLKVRVAYTSVGTVTDVKVACNLIFHAKT